MNNIFRGFLVALIFFNLNNNVFAQQTIINVPSSEVLPSGSLILKESNRFRPFAPGEYVGITPSFTLGVGHGIEVSSGVATSINDSTVVKGDISAKKVFFIGPSSRLTVGGTVSPYFSQHSTPDSFLYSHLSHRIKKTKTSVTAGMYLGGQKAGPSNAGVLLGFEQVIVTNKLRLAMDWLSGDESYGRIGVGLKYRPVPTVSITSAVIIPNKDSEVIGFNLSFSKFISLKDDNPIKRRL